MSSHLPYSLQAWRGFLSIMVLAFVGVEWLSLWTVSQELGVIESSASTASSRSDTPPLNFDLKSCFPHNSRAWLVGNRLSNFNLAPEEQELLYQQILSPPWKIFSHASTQTICHADSTFRNTQTNEWDVNDRKLVDEWELRLLFLALHHHQHAPARQEAQSRRSCSSLLTDHDMTSDFECSSAKFLIVNLEPIGMGASFRLGAIGSLFLGVATGRVVLFVNNLTDIVTTKAGNSNSNDNTSTTVDFAPWALASCPRGDYQCVFQAPTPCTVLADDLRKPSNETVFMREGDAQYFRRKGKFKKLEYETARFLVMKARVLPFNRWIIQDKIQARLYGIATHLINDMRETASPEQVAVLEAAASRISNVTSNNNEYNTTSDYQYSSRYAKTAHAALLYILRPNRHYQLLSDDIVDKLMPKNVDRSLSIGLPIRGSDKCRVESVCYGFDTYMKLAKRMWENNLQSPTGKHATIVLTTEDESIVNARNAYELNDSFPFRFIVNTNDTFQGSGHPANYKEQADDVMLSSIVSLKLQLRTKFVVGNCCSNFHLMLFDLVHSGCGAMANVKPQCLQEHPDPEFFICCEWTHTEVCDARRERQKEGRIRRFEQRIAEEKRLKNKNKRLEMTDAAKLVMAERKRIQRSQRKGRRNVILLNNSTTIVE